MVNVVPLILFSAVLYLSFLVRHLKQRRTLEEHLVFTVFFIYGVGVVGVCFFPMPVQRSLMVSMQHQPWHPSCLAWNPFRSLYLIITRDRLHDIVYTIGGNLVLLFPLGCLLPRMSTTMTRRKTWIWGVGTTVAIEALQFILDAVFGYAYRSPGLNQVVLNVVGFGLGWLLVQQMARTVKLPTYEWTNEVHSS